MVTINIIYNPADTRSKMARANRVLTLYRDTEAGPNSSDQRSLEEFDQPGRPFPESL